MIYLNGIEYGIVDLAHVVFAAAKLGAHKELKEKPQIQCVTVTSKRT